MLSLKIISVLLFLLAAIILFSLEPIPVETSALLLLCSHYFAGIVTTEQLFSSFGSDPVIMIAGVFLFGIDFNNFDFPFSHDP